MEERRPLSLSLNGEEDEQGIMNAREVVRSFRLIMR